MIIRKFAFLALCACLILTCAITISCGGSSSPSKTGCTGGPFDVVGDWTLTGSGSSGSSSGPGVINSSGLAVFFQTSTSEPAPGDTLVLPTITGICSFSGTVTAYGTPASGGGAASNSVQGNVESATSITAKIANGNTLSLAASSPLSGPITAFSGSGWIAEIEGWTGDNVWQLTFAPTGNNASMNFSGSSNLCDISGTFTQEQGGASDLNVFDVSITYSAGIGCPPSGNGIGFESSSDYFNLNGNAQGTYLYAASSSSASVLEVFKQTQ